jgi:selenocysteine lyase/cysteine desulfurase
VESCANQENTSLRTGCFCNPGAREKALDVSEEEIAGFYRQTERMTLEQFMTAMRKTGGEGRGAVRISLGLASNFADVYRFMQFAETFVDREA